VPDIPVRRASISGRLPSSQPPTSDLSTPAVASIDDDTRRPSLPGRLT